MVVFGLSSIGVSAVSSGVLDVKEWCLGCQIVVICLPVVVFWLSSSVVSAVK